MAQKGKQARDERIEESMNAPQKIDVNVEMRFPLSNSTIKKKYKCSMCGNSWDVQKSHFGVWLGLSYRCSYCFKTNFC